MLILCRVLLLLLCCSVHAFGLTASRAEVKVDVPVHVGGTRIAAGKYRLVWTNGLERTDVLVSVDGRHVSLPAEVRVDTDDRALGDRAIVRKDRDGFVLVGSHVKGLLILVCERR